jgi:hypothetical protein
MATLDSLPVPGYPGLTWDQVTQTPTYQALSSDAKLALFSVTTGQPDPGSGGGGFFQAIPGQPGWETTATRVAGGAAGAVLAPAIIAGAGGAAGGVVAGGAGATSLTGGTASYDANGNLTSSGDPSVISSGSGTGTGGSGSTGSGGSGSSGSSGSILNLATRLAPALATYFATQNNAPNPVGTFNSILGSVPQLGTMLNTESATMQKNAALHTAVLQMAYNMLPKSAKSGPPPNFNTIGTT